MALYKRIFILILILILSKIQYPSAVFRIPNTYDLF
jgi:hypothetical protein